MKKGNRILALLLALTTALSMLGAASFAVTPDPLEANTAVAGASKILQSFYESDKDASEKLNKFFHPEQPEEEDEYIDELVTYPEKKTAYVSAEELLNVRMEATTDADLLLTLERGEKITVLGERMQRIESRIDPVEFTWYYIDLGEIGKGYVRGEFVAFGEEGEAIYAEIQEEKNGKMPDHFDYTESLDALAVDTSIQLNSLRDEINYCQKLYADKLAEENYIDMYSILVYLCDLYGNIATVANANGLLGTTRKATNALEVVQKERDRLSMVTGNTEEDFYQGIQEQSAEYQAQKKAEEEAAKQAAEAEARRKAAEQAAREAADAEARRQAEEAARRAAAEAEAARQAQEAAQRAALEAAQAEAARIAASGAQEAADSMGRQIADYAATFIGVLPYVWGGASLVTGADCSGFIGQIMAHYGLLDQGLANIHGYDSRSLRTVGTPVVFDASSIQNLVKTLMPGDIICYDGHVAIYYGNGIVVHEPIAPRKAEFGSVMMKPILTIRRLAPLPSAEPETEPQASEAEVPAP